MVGIVAFIFYVRLPTRKILIESALHVDHAKLPVFAFTVGGHGPEKANAMTRNRDVWMIPAGHQHGVAITYNGDDFRIVSTVIHKLNAECRVGHIEIHVHLFQHLGVLVRRPARPVARFGDGEAGDQSSRLDVFCRHDRPNTPPFGNTKTGLPSSDYLSGVFACDGTAFCGSIFPSPGLQEGNLGRRTFQGPGFANTDFSVIKNQKIPWFIGGEGANLQFRTEFFNVFNRVNLTQVGTDIANLSNFGKPTSTYPARDIQFALRIAF
jgi:hypothetical protein